ncbi:hypothetical protein [Fredinandcohnia sp. 179-A 10B2 NHS]|uniref:hypothetical protein n=1 Tax=Fredinandcohnia sp. 179-A 10B2 NHS TaxID=3235176 RepID=UPI00399FABA9
MKEQLSNKDIVLDGLDEIILTLSKMEKVLQAEVNQSAYEEGNKNLQKVKQIENQLLSVAKVDYDNKEQNNSKEKTGRSFHLTYSY